MIMIIVVVVIITIIIIHHHTFGPLNRLRQKHSTPLNPTDCYPLLLLANGACSQPLQMHPHAHAPQLQDWRTKHCRE